MSKDLTELIQIFSKATMEGRIVWSSLDVYNLEEESKEKKGLGDGLLLAYKESREQMIKVVEHLALKGYKEDKILPQIGRKRARLEEIKRRTKNAYKSSRRLAKRAKKFKTELSRGWYIIYEVSYYGRKDLHRFTLEKHQDETGEIYYVASDCRNAVPGGVIRAIDSDKAPLLITLGFLLNNSKQRVIAESGKVYDLEELR